MNRITSPKGSLRELQGRMHEEGRIRIGEVVPARGRNGETTTRPAMRKTFLLTTTNKELLDFAAKVLGGEVKPWTPQGGTASQWCLSTTREQLRVAVSADSSFSQLYERWAGGGCTHRCNGETCTKITVVGKGKDAKATKEEIPCECDQDNPTCKPKTRLSVMLTELPALGRWRLETGGVIAGSEMSGMFDAIQGMGFTGGPVFCILTLEQKELKKPGEVGRKFAIPSLSLDPNPRSLPALIADVQASALAPVGRALGPGAKSLPQTGSADRDAGLAMRRIGIDNPACKAFASQFGADWVKIATEAITAGAENPEQFFRYVETGSIEEPSTGGNEMAEGEFREIAGFTPRVPSEIELIDWEEYCETHGFPEGGQDAFKEICSTRSREWYDVWKSYTEKAPADQQDPEWLIAHARELTATAQAGGLFSE